MIELWDRVHPYLEDLTPAHGTPSEQADLQMLAPLLSQISLYPTRPLVDDPYNVYESLQS